MPDFRATSRILIVDDEAFNLDILQEYLGDAGYEVLSATNGREALDVLSREMVDCIVLDRMMPVMDGMECLDHIKRDTRFADVPVIMQTAAASQEQIRQGVESGVYYYLTKPYEEDVLLSLVAAAVSERYQKESLRSEVLQQRQVLNLLVGGTFRFRTLEDAQALSVLVSNCFPDPERVVYGLRELLVNAVEHGNLGITYAEKTKLVRAGQWAGELNRRLNLPEYAERLATLELTIEHRSVSVTITDMGEGFDYSQYLDLSALRATDPNGRGIATARLLSFDSLVYSGTGNIVTCRVNRRQAGLTSVGADLSAYFAEDEAQGSAA